MTERKGDPPTSKAKTRAANSPLVRRSAPIRFVATCPMCLKERIQQAYSRQTLVFRLNAGSNIEAYCPVCKVYWPISESERRAISLR